MLSSTVRRASGLVRTTLLIALAASIPLGAQTATQTPAPQTPMAAALTAGTVERIKVHGTSLEGSLLGDSPDRDVAVFLPPGYKSSPRQRYPVVYMLHGFTDNVGQWWGDVKHFVNVPEAMRQTLSEVDGANEMILVMPNAYTRFQGSFYSSSVATGDWETFVSSELVAYIDKHYRTLAKAQSRGLFGHSMGGYGAIRIGMRHPDVFSSVYAMSACCLTPPASNMDPKRMERVLAITSPDEVAKADFGTKAFFATAAAWSPNPENSPLFVDLPVKDGQVRPEILAKWSANAPIAMADQYIGHLKRLRALAFDVGNKDGLAPGSMRLHELLDTYKVAHTYETYEGDHLNKIHERLRTKVFPFFSQNLATR